MRFSSVVSKVLVKQRIQNLLFLSIFIVFSVFRSPEIFFHGRFFAEEGSYFWAHALEVPWFSELFYVGSGTGYYLFNPTLLTALSSHLPLMLAPLLTVWSSLLIMCLPGLIYLEYAPEKNRIKLFSVAILLTYSLPALSLEVFANSINSQIFLGVSTYVILLVFPFVESKRARILLLSILVICSLNGWYSVLQIPIAFMNYFQFHNARNRKPLIVLGLGLVFQALIYLKQLSLGNILPSRFSNPNDLPGILADLKNLIRISLQGEIGLSKQVLTIFYLSTSLLLVLFTRIIIRKGLSTSSQEIFYLRFVVLTSLTFVIEFLLITNARAENVITGRYSVFLGILLLVFFQFGFLSLQHHFPKIGAMVLLPLIACLTAILTAVSSQSNYLQCVNPCINWQRQIDAVKNDSVSRVTHWPFGIGYYTDMRHPRETLRVAN